MSFDQINDDIKGQIMALELREKAFTKRLRQFAPAGAANCLAAAVALGVAGFLGPDAYPSSVDIPAHLLGLFSDAAPGGSSGSGLAGVTSATGSLASMITPMVIGMAGIFGVFNVVTGMLHGDMGRVVRGAIAPVFLVGTVMMASSLLGLEGDGGDDGGFGPSPRTAFVAAVSDRKYQAVAAALEKVGQKDSAEGLYVLAQVVLSKDALRATKPLAINAELAKKVAEPSKDFKPKAEALYAIELAALGAPQSPQAVAYRDDHLARQKTARGISSGLAVSGAALGAVGIAFGLLGRVVSRRIKRIHQMLGLTS
ncbi:TPA: hypothetical protein ACYSE6_006599 [Pseudomonas aeruginosa]